MRQTYQEILRSRVSDSAPLDKQHAWWRLHDQAKREYAIADWKWESLVLRVLICAAAIVAIVSVFITELTVVAMVLMVAALWRCYLILTRHAPD